MTYSTLLKKVIFYFAVTMGTVIGFAILTSALLITGLQVPFVQDGLVVQIERWFHRKTGGTLVVGRLSGQIPSAMILEHVAVFPPGKSETAIRVNRLAVGLTLESIWNPPINVTHFSVEGGTAVFQDSTDYQFLTRLSKNEKALEVASEKQKGLKLDGVLIQLDSIVLGESLTGIHGKPLHIRQLFTTVNLDAHDEVLEMEIASLKAYVPILSEKELSLKATLIAWPDFVDVSAVDFSAGSSKLQASAEIRKRKGAAATGWEVQTEVKSFHVEKSDWKIDPDLIPEKFPALTAIQGSFSAGISSDLVTLRRAVLESGNMKVQFEAEVRNPKQSDRREVSFSISEGQFPSVWLKKVYSFPPELRVPETIGVKGSGNLTSNALSARTELQFGQTLFQTTVSLNPSDTASDIVLKTTFRGLNVKHLLVKSPLQTNVSGVANLRIIRSQPEVSADYQVQLVPSDIAHLSISSAKVQGSISRGLIKSDVRVRSASGHTSFLLDVNLLGLEPQFKVQGNMEGIDLSKIIPGELFNSTLLNGSYALNFIGNDPSSFYGTASIDFDTSFVNRKIVPYHQIFVDLNSPLEAQRRFRLASSLVDAEISGAFDPAAVPPALRLWAADVLQKVHRELLFDGRTMAEEKEIIPFDVTCFVQIKNDKLLSNYSPLLTGFVSSGILEGDFQVNNTSAAMRFTFKDESFAVKNFGVTKPSVLVSATLQRGIDLKDKSAISVEVNYDSLYIADSRIGKTAFSLNQFNETAQLRFRSRGIAQYGWAVLNADVLMSVESLDLIVREGKGGFKNYDWAIQNGGVLAWAEGERLLFKDFVFRNAEEKLRITGAISKNADDEVTLEMEQLDVKRVSDVIRYQFGFSGKINGSFTGNQMLSESPRFAGSLKLEHLALNGRTVGDVQFLTRFNNEKSQFDTKLSILTDPVKYASYLAENKGIGQDIQISGFFKPPGKNTRADEPLFSFSLDVRSFDAWIVGLWTPKVFQRLEGLASGTGTIAGSASSVQFHGEFDVKQSTLVPVFLNTTYYATGPITIDRKEGIRFENLTIRDSYSGRGSLFGYIDWNDFNPGKPMFFEGNMQNMQFLNNFFTPDVPFFGTVAGSGTVRLSGTTEGLILQTVGRCVVTPGSKITIPLLDVERFDEKANFIQFSADQKATPVAGNEVAEQKPVTTEKTFVELFTMNLQFDVPSMSSVKLLFDPVINEALSADGSGQMIITLEKELFNVYGKLDLVSGDYLFNGGDLITRKFQLQPGGTMSWDGDPVNGFLNARAVYRARPDISPVLPNASIGTDNNRNRIYVPINLVLHMSGPLYQLQHDFFFELESNVATAQDANILAAINTLNNPQTKLIQASSLMLTGGFLEDSQSQAARLGNDFDNRVTQNYFAQLISNQINAMLSKNISNVDVNLNMQGFNQFSQTELGVSVRLLDDRLVLRREGVISGQNANIGDLGATYRINEYLSVEAFHKQDPTQNIYRQGTATGQQQAINGVGLEAQVQFESWRDLKKRTKDAWKKTFRSKKNQTLPDSAKASTL